MKRAQSSCLLCGVNGKLVDSHVVPRSFFRSVDGDGKLLSVDGAEPPKRAPKGVYDQIVCEGCERLFSLPDDYAFKVLGNLEPGRHPDFLRLDVDYDLIKRFVLSVLWRAGVSRQPFYDGISLGPNRAHLTELVRDQTTGSPTEFSFYMARIIEVQVGVVKPVWRRYRFADDYRNLYFFAFGSIALYIKSDHRPMPGVINELILKPDGQLILPAIPLESLHLEQTLWDLVRNNANAFGSR